VVVTSKALYVREVDGGPSRVAVFDHDGTPQGVMPLADLATVDEVEPLGDGTLLYSIRTFLRPPYFSRYARRAAPRPTQFGQTARLLPGMPKSCASSPPRRTVKSRRPQKGPDRIKQRTVAQRLDLVDRRQIRQRHHALGCAVVIEHGDREARRPPRARTAPWT